MTDNELEKTQQNESESCNCQKRTVRSEEEKHSLSCRINRIAGQLGGIRRMIEDDRYCEDILIQLSAVNNAVKSLAAYIIEQHMKGCIVADIKAGNDAAADEILALFKRFMH